MADWFSQRSKRVSARRAGGEDEGVFVQFGAVVGRMGVGDDLAGVTQAPGRR
jgi:hypothetical protein